MLWSHEATKAHLKPPRPARYAVPCFESKCFRTKHDDAVHLAAAQTMDVMAHAHQVPADAEDLTRDILKVDANSDWCSIKLRARIITTRLRHTALTNAPEAPATTRATWCSMCSRARSRASHRRRTPTRAGTTGRCAASRRASSAPSTAGYNLYDPQQGNKEHFVPTLCVPIPRFACVQK